jgi:hypothetical protein
MSPHRIIRLAALALAMAAITASTAAAMPPRESPSYPSDAAMQPIVSAVKASQPTSAADGFHWGNAGLGAVMTGPVLLAVGSAVYLVQRRRVLGHRQPRSIG